VVVVVVEIVACFLLHFVHPITDRWCLL